MQEINDALHVSPETIGLSPPEEIKRLVGDTRVANDPIIDTDGDWILQTQKLKSRKDYK